MRTGRLPTGAQTLELDRSSEPAALAAARGGSLPPASQPGAQHAPAPPVSQSSAHQLAEVLYTFFFCICFQGLEFILGFRISASGL